MVNSGPERILLDGVAKTFVMHLRGGARLPVVCGVCFSVRSGECVALSGPSGIGKSSILKLIYGNYRVDAGRVLVTAETGTVDVASASPRQMLALRRTTLCYVSQFLRTIPRVPTIDIVAEPLLALGVGREAARHRAAALLERLALPHRFWELPPATFSGGEQQRVNIARGLIAGHPILLVDEPTASLDAANRATVVDLLQEARKAGKAIIAICHEEATRAALATRLFPVPLKAQAA